MGAKVIGLAMIYQSISKEGVKNIARCYLDEYVDGKDEYDYKAKAERYFKDDEKLKGSKLVAWHVATGEVEDE